MIRFKRKKVVSPVSDGICNIKIKMLPLITIRFSKIEQYLLRGQRIFIKL